MWDTWQARAPKGEGEERGIAIDRMKDCIKRGTFELDLHDLNLSSLPDTLPPLVEVLDISDNRLVELSNLSKLHNLRELKCSWNRQLLSMSELPKGLELLDLSYCSLSSFSAEQLPSLKNLNLYKNKLIWSPTGLDQLSTKTTVDLRLNPLSERTLSHLYSTLYTNDYNGPVIIFSDLPSEIAL